MLLVTNSELGRMLAVDVVVLSIVVVTAKEIHGIISRLEHTGSKHEDHGENLLHKIERTMPQRGGGHFIAGEKLSDRSA